MQSNMRKVRVVAISDTHSYFDELEKFYFPPADIFIHAGDISCNSGSQDFQKFRKFMEKIPYKHKIVIGGNHDFGLMKDRKTYLDICDYFEISEEYRIDNLAQRKKLKECCIFLQHQYIEIEGIKIFASPYIQSSHVQGFQLTHEKAQQVWSQIPEGLDILITHMPPFGILDKIKDGRSVGAKKLRQVVDKVKPKIHIFGHIHQSHGNVKVNKTHFYNVSHLNKYFIADHDPTVIEFQIQLSE